MSISLEAREILNHLNGLGYRNITSDQLKEFMTGKLQCFVYYLHIDKQANFRFETTHQVRSSFL